MISAGPFPLMALIALGALAIAWGVARTLAKEARSAAGAVVLDAFLLGLLAARLVHVGMHAADYLAQPLSLIRLGDGGYAIWAGMVATVAFVLWKTPRQAPRKPVVLGLVAGTLFWVVGGAGLLAVQRASISLPEAVLVDTAGNAAPLAEFAGKPTVINLWATWCGPCRREMPVLAEAQRRHPQVQFVFANQGESRDEVTRYLAAEQMVLDNILLDAESQVMQQTGARALPTTLFFDADGRLRDVHMGELSRATLERRLREMR